MTRATAINAIVEKWGRRYPAVIRLAVIRLGDNAWSEFISFLDYGVEIRRARSTIWTMRWKPADAFAITFGDRFPAAETY